MESRRHIHITRKYPLPVDRIYRAWSDPRELAQWAWGRIGKDCHAEIDFRIGGRFIVSTARPDGTRWSFSGIYTELDPYRRIKHTLDWDAPMGYENGDETVSVEFTAESQGATVTFLHEGDFSVKSKEVHEEGWVDVLDTLALHLSKQGQP